MLFVVTTRQGADDRLIDLRVIIGNLGTIIKESFREGKALTGGGLYRGTGAVFALLLGFPAVPRFGAAAFDLLTWNFPLLPAEEVPAELLLLNLPEPRSAL